LRLGYGGETNIDYGQKVVLMLDKDDLHPRILREFPVRKVKDFFDENVFYIRFYSAPFIHKMDEYTDKMSFTQYKELLKKVEELNKPETFNKTRGALHE